MLATYQTSSRLRGMLLETAAPSRTPGTLRPGTARSAKYKLDDPDVIEALAKKYEHLAVPGPLYRKIAEAYGLLGRILASPGFADDSLATSEMRAQADTSRTIATAMRSMELDNRVVDKGADGVTTFLNFPDLTIRIPGKGQAQDRDGEKIRNAGLQVMRALFPKFESIYGTPVENYRVQYQTEERIIPIEALAQIRVPGVPPLDIASWDKGYRGLVRFVLNIASASAFTSDPLSEEDSISVAVSSRVEVTFPEEYARWATSTTSEDTWAPSLFLQHAQRVARWWNSPDQKGRPPAPRSQHPLDHKITSDLLGKTYLIGPRPKVNAEGITMVPDGRLIWVPDGGDFHKHVETLRNIVDGEGRVDFSRLKNAHVATDWTLEKLYITDAMGRMTVIDLMGARPLDDATIGHVLEGAANIDMLGRIVQMCSTIGINVNKAALRHADDRIGPIAYENLIDVPYFPDESDPRNRDLYAVGQAFGELYTRMSQGSEFSPYEQLEVRPYVALFGVYGRRRVDYARALIDMRADNSARPEGDEVKLSNLPGVDGIMPHQNKLFNTLSTNPTGAILDVSAGGGKTLAYIFDIADLMRKGLVKRPAVVMPRNLIAQFANELAAKFSKGYFKPFPINSRVWRSWMVRMKSNPQAVRNIINSMPKNTIFLIDYGWLAQNAVTLEVNGDTMRVYPHALMLASLGFDYIAVDESQRAKKINTGRTQAVNILAASAKYRRIGSGTILHNTARDLLGQMSIINPMALGVVGDALKESDRVSIDRLPLLRKNVETFARRLKVSRREWAHLLPTLHERVHTVKLTRNQNEFYDKIMKDLVEQVANDPKVLNLVKKQNENAEEKLTAMFKRYLAKVEIWLNAPDSSYNEKQYGNLFKAVPGITRQDLMSPKIAAIDQIVEMHLRGGSQDVDGRMEELDADPFKIMIVGYNKAVSEHVFEHMHHKALAVHYRAGDDALLERFKTDDSLKILVADETAMQEGHNMQSVSRIIRLQSLWTPGGQEQLLARMMRPDVPDAEGKIKYARDRVWLDWIVVDNSIEIAKMARLIGKLVENSVIQEIDTNPNLAKVVQANKGTFDRIKRIKMDLDFIRDRGLQTVEMLQDQFTAYQVFKGWENTEFASEKKRLRAEIEERVGRKIKPGELGPLSMLKVPVELDPTLDPGKRLFGIGYTPFIEGFSGYNPTGLNLQPITLPPPEEEDEDTDVGSDDDGSDDDENVHVDVGDVVATEFGLGYISQARRGARQVWVKVPGFRKSPIRLMRYNVLGPTNEEDKETLRRLLQQAKQVNVLTMDENSGDLATKPAAVDDSTIQTLKKTAKSLKSAPPKPTVTTLTKQTERAPPLPPTVTKPLKTGRKPTVTTLDMQKTDTSKFVDSREFTAGLYNGVYVLVAEVKDEEADQKLRRLGFDYLARQVIFTVKTPRAFGRLVEALAAKFYIPRAHKAILDDFAEMFIKRRENIAYLKPQAYKFHTSWLRAQKRRAKEKNELHPYPVVDEEGVHVYINAKTCPAALRLKGFTPPPGVSRPTMIEEGYVKFLANRSEAVQVMNRFEERKGRVTNRKTVIATLKTLKG